MGEDLIEVDGSAGEGGGQILRTCLGLSLVTKRTFRITNIRARRRKPGLLRQHLTAVNAAASLGGARTQGADIGSGELVFEPGELRSGHHEFAIGTAGSTTLVLQAVLPALLRTGPGTLKIEGGTHNPMAPPFEFIRDSYVPLLRRMGADLDVELERVGFHPAGGGKLVARFGSASELLELELLERGAIREREAIVLLSELPDHVAERELDVLRHKLRLEPRECRVQRVDALGPGNAVCVRITSEHVTEVFTAFGTPGRRAEVVAKDAAEEARRYLRAGVPVGEHLADQLLLPLALAGGGRFRTLRPSRHARTNAETIERFLEVSIEFIEGAGAWEVSVG